MQISVTEKVKCHLCSRGKIIFNSPEYKLLQSSLNLTGNVYIIIIIIIITNFYTGLKNPSVCNTVVLGVLYVLLCSFFSYSWLIQHYSDRLLNNLVERKSWYPIGSLTKVLVYRMVDSESTNRNKTWKSLETPLRKTKRPFKGILGESILWNHANSFFTALMFQYTKSLVFKTFLEN